MKHLCFKISLIFIFITNLFAFHLAFFYGNGKIPKELIRSYDMVVVNSGIVKKINPKLAVYVSICEQGNRNELKKDWIVGKNGNWNSYIMDIRNINYQKFLLNKIDKLYQKGFRNFFFDTMDSYKSVLPKKEWASYEKSLAFFINKVYNKYHIKIILNRGFEVFDKVSKDIYAVVCESLFQGYNGKKYVKVPENDRKWLINKLNHIKSKNVKVVVVDYVKPKNRKKAKLIALKIKKLGFIPYVADGDLKTIGISDFTVFRRKILLIYVSNKKSKMLIDAHRMLQLPIEYLGYVADLKTPKEAEKLQYTIDKYSGIVVWSELDKTNGYDKFYKWILKRIKNNNKVLFIANFGFPQTDKYLSKLNIKVQTNKGSAFDNFKIIKKDKSIEYETTLPSTLPYTFLIPQNANPLLTIKTSNNQIFSPIAITKWGGYAVDPYVDDSYLSDVKWIVNPFYLLKSTLHLENIPKPDYTTENGERIFFSHLDGDASMSRVEFDPSKLSCEEIRDAVLKRFKKVPFGISFIEGEIEPYGLYPKLSKRLLADAKSIFALKNVEPASHTFSHPFFWRKDAKLEGHILPKNYNLPIPNYKFSIYREIVGSCKNLSKLSPPDKPDRILFWSGDCDPPAKALKIAYQNHILNMNGGDTTIMYAHNYLSNIAPAGVNKGGYYQIYTGEQDEFIYTDGFTKNFWGYKKVIQTFKLTDKPRRFKPIDIYFHFYIGSKKASLDSLIFVFNWVLKHKVIRFWVSDYIKKVLDFYNTVLIKEGNYWIIKTNKQLRTLRIKGLGYPDLKKSKGIVGFFPYDGNYYLSLDGSGEYKLYFTKKKPKKVYLYQSNARIVKVNKNYYKLKAALVNVKVKFKNFKNCKVISKYRYKIKNGWIYFNSPSVGFRVECKK